MTVLGAPVLAQATIDTGTPWTEVPGMLLPAYAETLAMVGIVMAVVVSVGLPLGVLLHNVSPLGLFPRERTYQVLSSLVNVGRSLPFLILMAAIIPFTRFVVGTSIGISGAIVPMAVAGIPFFSRLVQNAVREVRSDVTDMSIASGAAPLQIVRSVQLSEAMPALAAALTLNTVAMIEYSAIAGSIGAGGIGNLAISYGYNRFDGNIMIATVLALIVTVQVVQFTGDRTVKALTR